MRILLVEDDEAIIEVLTAILTDQHYVVDIATDGEAGWELVEAFPYDLVLLDIILPKLDGIAFCRKLRSQKNQVLVMLLTARDTTTDKLIGLDAGADDYVVKPFDVQELAARIRALLRRGTTVAPSILSCGNLRLDPSACEVTHNGELLRFSRKEYLLLELFLRQQHRVFSRSAIVDQIWSFNEDPPNEDTVKSHIKSIRRKLNAVGAGDMIETLYGQGYRINPAYSSAQSSPPEEAAASKQEALALSVAEIWQRTKGISLKRITFLTEFVEALKAAQVDQELCRQAIQNAHKLAGSLGTFGYETGSQLARQLESLLQSKLDSLTQLTQQEIVPEVEQFTKALQAELNRCPQITGQLSHPLETVKQAAQQSAVIPAMLIEAPAPLLLLLEQDGNLVEAVSALATEHQLRLVKATTVEEAEQQVQQERPNAAVIDFALLQPAKLGQPLLANLQKQPSVPIIFLSCQARAKDRVEAVQAGGSLFLTKPVTPDAIFKAVSTALSFSQPEQLRGLVVDDDPIIAAMLASCLASQGIQLTGLSDPSEFWETIGVVQPHLLILDVNMPEIDGLQLCQTVRNDPNWNWLPILFLTAQTDSKTVQKIFQVGADDFIAKPIVPFEVSTRVFNRLRRTQSRQLYTSSLI
jgi:DNA-binding response OmpR family regulator